MKFLLISLALIGLAAGAQLPDSATQGPNPQDIATPEPEYIDIDLPEPPRPAAPLPSIQSRSSFSSASSSVPSLPRPVVHRAAPSFSQSFLPQQSAPQVVPGHIFSPQSGYQYRRPVYIRRVYRRRF